MGSTNPTNLWLNTTTTPLGDLGDMVVVVKWYSNYPYASLSSSSNDCSL
jgi:hypothetical protein